MSGAGARLAMGLAVATPPLAFGAAALTRPLQDPDVFWLIAGGRRLASEGLPLTNGLSWTAPEHPWVLHEPLVAWAYSAAGFAGLPWLRAIVLSALLLGLIRAASGRGAWAALLSLCCALPLVSVGLSERAMASGALIWLGTLGCLRPWEAHPAPHARRAAAAGLVVLGSVTHGSFALGLLLLALFAPGWALLALALASLLPGGWERVALVWSYGQRSDTLILAQGYVEEWAPLWPEDAAWALRLTLALLGAGIMARRGGWRVRLLTALLLGLSLRHRRFVMELGVAMTPWVSAWLAARLPHRAEGPALGVSALGLAGLCALSPPGVPDPSRYPPEIAALARGGGPTWSDLQLGAWLAHEGTPAFWDARNDCYPAEVFADGLRLATRSDGWIAALTVWQVEQVVTTDAELARALRGLGWRALGEAGTPAMWVLRSPSSVDTLSPN